MAAEAFGRLWSHWGQIHGEDHAGGYVFKTAMRLCSKRRRRAAREVVGTVPERSRVTDPDARVTVIDALRGLPLRQRQSVVLRDWAGFETSEVARMLDEGEHGPGASHARSGGAAGRLDGAGVGTMNDVRDEALGATLEQEAHRIETVPVDRLPEVLRRGNRLRAIRFTAIGAALAVFAGATSLAGLSLRNETIESGVTRRYSSRAAPWTFNYPSGWTTKTISRAGPELKTNVLRTTIVNGPMPSLANDYGPNSVGNDALTGEAGDAGAIVLVVRFWGGKPSTDDYPLIGPGAFGDDAETPVGSSGSEPDAMGRSASWSSNGLGRRCRTRIETSRPRSQARFDWRTSTGGRRATECPRHCTTRRADTRSCIRTTGPSRRRTSPLGLARRGRSSPSGRSRSG